MRRSSAASSWPGFPQEMHAVVVYRVLDGLIHDVALLT